MESYPPEAEMDIQDQMKVMHQRWLEIEKDNTEIKRENKELKKNIPRFLEIEKDNKELKKNMEEMEQRMKAQERAKAMYNEFGGEDIFYMDLEDLLPKMREAAEGDEEKLKMVDKWAAKARKTRSKRIAVAFGSGAALGAVAGGSTLAVHATLACATCASIAAGPAALILIGSALGGAVVIGMFIGIYKLHRMYKMSMEKEKRKIQAALTSVVQSTETKREEGPDNKRDG